jgi:TatD DNase family protein
MTEITDTHAHLDFKDYKKDIEEVLSRAYDHGITKIINISSTPSSIDKTLLLTKTHAMIYGALGIHPHDSKHANNTHYEHVIREAGYNNKIVAIGEIGLDYHYDHSPHDIQQEVFRRFIGVAKQLCLPVIVHERKAPEDTLKILNDEDAASVGGVVHCFSGDIKQAKKVLDLGFYISVTGVVTFKNAQVTKEVVKYVPIDRLLIETDSPFLTPAPHRGKRNEPYYVKFVAEHIAELRGMDFEDFCRCTTENASKLFKI